MTDKNLEERVLRERINHSNNDVLGKNIKLKSKFPHLNKYPSKLRLFEKIDELTKDLTDQIVLDYGCGRGAESVKYLNRGARIVYGIDISPEYIENAKFTASSAGYDESCLCFKQMDAHKLLFDNEKFDLVIGKGILHHLSIELALNEIYRVLKPGGKVIFLEPLAGNPLLKIFRFVTPKVRTPDETPFTCKQINTIINSHVWSYELFYCGIFNMPVSMITSLLFPHFPDNFFIKIADKFEHWTYDKRILLTCNQYILFYFAKPEK